MNGSVEERLRRVLTREATTTTFSDGWSQIQQRLECSEAKRRPFWLRPRALVPALAAILAVVILVVPGEGGRGELLVTNSNRRTYLMPTGVEPRFHIVQGDTDPPFPAPPPGAVRVFGRRAPDGVALTASVVITVPAETAVLGGITEPEPLHVLGLEIPVARDYLGQRILSWVVADGSTVEVATYGLTDAELVQLAGSLVGADPRTAAPLLPAGFVLVKRGRAPEPRSVSFQNWQTDQGDTFGVNVTSVPGASLDDLATWLPGGRTVRVRGRTGIISDRSGVDLEWIEARGAVVTIYSRGISEQEVLRIAEGLRVVDARAWKALLDRAKAGRTGDSVTVTTGLGNTVTKRSGNEPADPPPDTVQPLTSKNSYFLVRPVIGRSDPPCSVTEGGPLAPIVVQKRDNQEVACYRLGWPLINADSVGTAAAREDVTSGAWEVAVTLTTVGKVSYQRLVDQVGTQGELAVVVDGEVVAVVRTQDPGPEFVVTGLGEPAALRLAERLRR